jgi:hypothetical protein
MFSTARRSAQLVIHLHVIGVFLVVVSFARAENITYNIADYPASQLDRHIYWYTGLTDHVTGTITTNGNLGMITPNDIVSATQVALVV